MSKINDAIISARMFMEQIEQEFSDLIQSYHIGSPRKEGVWLKVTGVKDALDVIEKETKIAEKPKEVPVPAPTPEPMLPPEPEESEETSESGIPSVLKKTKKK